MKSVKQLIISIYAVALAPFGHAAAPTQPDVYDLFRFGEIQKSIIVAAYNRAIADQIADKYEGHVQFIKKLGAPENIVSSIQAFKDVVTKLPWNKPWSDADGKAWGAAVLIPDAPREEWFKTLPDQGFNFWLGYISMSTAYDVGQGVIDRGETISAQSTAIKNAASNSRFLQTGVLYVEARKNVNPAVLETLKQIASIGTKLDDPLGDGLTTADITALRDGGLQLRSLAKDKKLLK